MADATTDLSDDQIDKLLFEAECRLAVRGSQNGLVPTNHLTTAAATSTVTTLASTVNTTIGLPKPPTNQSKELSVRVPEPIVRKKKAAREDAGSDWYNLPRTSNDPQVKRDLQILKLRSVLAMGKQHFKKDTRKDPFPEFSQVGTVVEGPTDFYSGRLIRKERKRTLVEEVLASGSSLSKFKAKYNEIQERKTSGKKAHYKKLVARRRRHG